jgi:4-carboxymuconolactone decarboxylase
LTFRGFGDVYAQSKQSLMTRQFATIAVLAVLGCAAPQLRFHIGAGMNVGITEEQVVEIIAWAQYFAGAPAAYNALVELKAALAAGSTATPGYQ